MTHHDLGFRKRTAAIQQAVSQAVCSARQTVVHELLLYYSIWNTPSAEIYIMHLATHLYVYKSQILKIFHAEQCD